MNDPAVFVEPQAVVDPVRRGRPLRLLSALIRLSRVRAVAFGGASLALLVAVILVGPLVIPSTPEAMDVAHALSPPASRHLFGTDDFGRDVFTRVVYGGRISLAAGLAATLLAACAGTAMGMVFGFYGGLMDSAGMRLLDVIMAFPNLLLALAVVAVLGSGIRNTVVAVGVTFVPLIARMVRAGVLRLSREEFVLAARAMGSDNRRILWHHVVPNVVPTVTVTATLVCGWAVLSVSSLSFIGLAVKPPTPEWGAMLSESRSYLQTAWWVAAGPGVALVLFILNINVLGDGLRQAFDPRLKY